MPLYKIALLSADGKAFDHVELDAADDKQAVCVAKRLKHGHGVEIREGERLVQVVAGAADDETGR